MEEEASAVLICCFKRKKGGNSLTDRLTRTGRRTARGRVTQASNAIISGE